VGQVLDLHRCGRSWADAIASIQDRHGHYTWVHAVNNACLVTAALLWGGRSWTDAVGLAVQAGWDTDSNGATVGSIMGAALGHRAIPERLTAPLHDLVRPGLFGLGPTKISELAARTTTLASAFSEAAGGPP
jgi:ADP-ribosylglycohydrolase